MALLAITACGRGPYGGHEAPMKGDMTIEQARAFNDFTLYWLGDTYQGFSLTRINQSGPGEVTFTYGTCTTDDPSGECSHPFDLQEQPNCAVTPAMIGKQASMIRVRGADALVEPGNGIRLWTGDVTIQIYNDTLDAAIERLAAQSLIPVKGQNLPSSAPLPRTIACGSSTPSVDSS